LPGTAETPTRNAVERHSIDFIPLEERHGKAWHQATLWFAGNAVLATLAVGVIGIGLGLSLFWTLVAGTLGTLVGTFFMASHSVQGPRLGIPQMLQSRPQFGYFGALLPQAVAVLLYIGFNVFNTILAGQALHQILGLDPHVGLVVAAIVAFGVGALGYDVIHRLQRYGTWLFLVFFGLLSVSALFTVHLPAAHHHVGHLQVTAFMVVFAAAVSYQLSEAPYVSDYSRYLAPNVTGRACFLWTSLGSALGTLWMVFLGAFLVAGTGSDGSDPVAVINTVGNRLFDGYGTVCLVGGSILMFTVITMNMYCGSLAALSIADTIRPLQSRPATRLAALATMGAASTVIALLASSNFLSNYGTFLTTLLYFLIPWSAINLVDFYFVRKERYSLAAIFDRDGIYGRWQWRGLVAYAIGFGASVPFFSTAWFTGPAAEALSGTDLSFFVGLAGAAAAYAVAARSLDVEAELSEEAPQRVAVRDEPVVPAVLGLESA
jgi:NCS1 family nucleobase:cation symporter-1